MLTMAATLNTLTDGNVKDILATFEGLRRSVGASNMQRLVRMECSYDNLIIQCQIGLGPRDM